jgi:hypothetical protein
VLGGCQTERGDVAPQGVVRRNCLGDAFGQRTRRTTGMVPGIPPPLDM